MMLKTKPTLFENNTIEMYQKSYQEIHEMLIHLLDTPIISTQHIGSTAINGALTSGIIDILVVVDSLHAMTTLDEKRLNLQHFYRMHHAYDKKCVYKQFDNLKSLNETARLHIVEANSKKLNKYITGQSLAEQNRDNFNTFKADIDVDVSLLTYENIKSDWFKHQLSV